MCIYISVCVRVFVCILCAYIVLICFSMHLFSENGPKSRG